VLTDVCPAFIIAIARNPSIKLAFFPSAWKDRPEWIEHAEQTVESVRKTSYRGQCAAVVAA
jgi:hypothetical protein